MPKKDTFVTLLPFMLDELCLKGNELIVYAVIYGFTMHGEGGWFTGSASYIADWCGCTRQTVFNALRSLEEKGMIKRRENVQGVADYRALRPGEKFDDDQKISQDASKNLTPPVKKFDTPCQNFLHHNIEKSIEENIEEKIEKKEHPEVEDAIEGFIAHRKEVKRPMTARAVKMFRKRLDDLFTSPAEKVAAIDEAICNGWLSVYAHEPPREPPKASITADEVNALRRGRR